MTFALQVCMVNYLVPSLFSLFWVPCSHAELNLSCHLFLLTWPGSLLLYCNGKLGGAWGWNHYLAKVPGWKEIASNHCRLVKESGENQIQFPYCSWYMALSPCSPHARNRNGDSSMSLWTSSTHTLFLTGLAWVWQRSLATNDSSAECTRKVTTLNCIAFVLLSFSGVFTFLAFLCWQCCCVCIYSFLLISWYSNAWVMCGSWIPAMPEWRVVVRYQRCLSDVWQLDASDAWVMCGS